MSDIITEDNKDIMRKWNKELYVDIGDKRFYFTHYRWEVFDNDFNVVDCTGKAFFSTKKS